MTTVHEGPRRPLSARTSKGVPVLLVFCAALAAAIGQGGKDPLATSLLRESAESHGAPVGAVRTLEASGTFVAPSGEEVPFRVLADGLERLRWEFGEGRARRVVLIREGVGFGFEGGARRSLNARETAGLRGELLPVLALGQWASASNQRVERSSDAASAEVSRTPAGADEDSRREMAEASRVRIGIDPESGLADSVELEMRSRGGQTSLPLRILFSDYAEVDGALWPALAEVFLDGRPAGAYVFKHVRLNAPVGDSDFAAE